MGKRHTCTRAYRKAAKHGGNPAIILRKVNRYVEAKFGFAEPETVPTKPKPAEQKDHKHADS